MTLFDYSIVFAWNKNISFFPWKYPTFEVSLNFTVSVTWIVIVFVKSWNFSEGKFNQANYSCQLPCVLLASIFQGFRLTVFNEMLTLWKNKMYKQPNIFLREYENLDSM